MHLFEAILKNRLLMIFSGEIARKFGNFLFAQMGVSVFLKKIVFFPSLSNMSGCELNLFLSSFFPFWNWGQMWYEGLWMSIVCLLKGPCFLTLLSILVSLGLNNFVHFVFDHLHLLFICIYGVLNNLVHLVCLSLSASVTSNVC